MEELKKEDAVENRKAKIKTWFSSWIKDSHNKIFLGIFVLAIIIRIYFLINTLHQPVWWDAADYLTGAKVLGNGLDIGYVFNPRRAFLMPLLWAGLIKLGLGEVSFRILEFLFSIAAVPALYFLGSKMFNKKVGLISSFLISVFWMHIFYSNRLMTEIPTLTFLIIASYFFWQAYAFNKEKNYIWWGIFLGLAFLARAGTLVMFAVFPIFLVITQRFKIFKKKYLWLGVLCTLVLMASFFVFTSFYLHKNAIPYFLALTPETGEAGGTRFSNIMGLPGIWEYVNAMPHYFGLILMITFYGSLVIFLLDFILGLDLIVRRKETSLDSYLFLFIFALIPFIFQSVFYNHFEDRYLMNAFPAFFLIMGLGLTKLSPILKNIHKFAPIIVIVAILGFGAYHQLTYGNPIIDGRKSSYLEVKQAGLWIKDNSLPGDIIISRSQPQMTYYAERKTLHPPDNETEFEELIEKEKPTFFMVSVFEPHQDWMYQYPASHNSTLIPVKAYSQGNQPVAVIYRFNYT